MTEHFNKLTPAEAERLALLIEECAEVQHAACKVLRHGYESRWPVEKGPTNRETLTREIGHVLASAERLMIGLDIDMRGMYRARDEKQVSVATYLHHQDDRS